MKHYSCWLDANTTNCVDLEDYNTFNGLGKSGKPHFPDFYRKKIVTLGIQSIWMLWIACLLLIFGSFQAVEAAKRYEVRRPVTHPLVVQEENPKSDGLLPNESVFPWESDFETAKELARNTNRSLLIYFYAEDDLPELLKQTEETFIKQGAESTRQLAQVPPSEQKPLSIAAACTEFEVLCLTDRNVEAKLHQYVLLKLPLDAVTKTPDGSEMKILAMPEFGEMIKHPGLAVIDFENEGEPYFGQLVGVMPFWRGVAPAPEETLTFLTLPRGTLTQRTLIYAMRIHPDHPLSTEGEPSPLIAQAATEHSEYQAEKNVLGHQNYGTRSSRLLDALGGGSPSEICAQSWSDESLYEAAIGCVRAWRHSSAHWSMAKKPHTYYGYDIVRGKNGAWYATGIFVDF
jgi:hypothetical protein